jgi:hypothetical protein
MDPGDRADRKNGLAGSTTVRDEQKGAALEAQRASHAVQLSPAVNHPYGAGEIHPVHEGTAEQARG